MLHHLALFVVRALSPSIKVWKKNPDTKKVSHFKTSTPIWLSDLGICSYFGQILSLHSSPPIACRTGRSPPHGCVLSDPHRSALAQLKAVNWSVILLSGISHRIHGTMVYLVYMNGYGFYGYILWEKKTDIYRISDICGDLIIFQIN